MAPNLDRISANELTLKNAYGIDVRIFANEQVPIDPAAVGELQSMLELQATVESFYKEAPQCFSTSPGIECVALTPDFHKALISTRQKHPGRDRPRNEWFCRTTSDR